MQHCGDSRILGRKASESNDFNFRNSIFFFERAFLKKGLERYHRMVRQNWIKRFNPYDASLCFTFSCYDEVRFMATTVRWKINSLNKAKRLDCTDNASFTIARIFHMNVEMASNN